MAINVNSIVPTNAYYKTTPVGVPKTNLIARDDFSSVFEAAKNLIKETNAMEQNAQDEAVKFALGEADNPHDMMIAAQKAAVTLQYTNAIRTSVIQSYQTIMQMQI